MEKERHSTSGVETRGEVSQRYPSNKGFFGSGVEIENGVPGGTEITTTTKC